jgi:hypothetical protein
MRYHTLFLGLSAAVAIAAAVACSHSGPASISPSTIAPIVDARFRFSRYPSVLDPAGLRIASPRANRAGFDSCPASGATEYVSDEFNSVIDIYNGKFAGQAPCGQITATLLIHPNGLYVDRASHDLYVANWGGSNILVFHKGQTVPYNIYADPAVPLPYDVALSGDGTVVASNEEASGGFRKGSISTWVGGPNGGTFVGNYPMTNDDFGLYLTIRPTGTIYFNDIDATSGIGALWSVTCPAGVCGAQTQVSGVSFKDPGGMAFDDTGDLLVNDATASTLDTFELPNPQPSTTAIPCCPIGMAYDTLHQHWLATSITYAAEYSYPSFTLIGTVPVTGGALLGIAVDP